MNVEEQYFDNLIYMDVEGWHVIYFQVCVLAHSWAESIQNYKWSRYNCIYKKFIVVTQVL